ncbi:MAG: histidine kinase [Desulfatibacillum sp.]|nr:histidine kinase [Desulfatibacillum sp.]
MGAYLSLRTKIFLLLAGLVGVNCVGAASTLWYTYSTQKLYKIELSRGISSLIAAQDLETALIMQKGYTTYFFLDGDIQWLESLKEHQLGFRVGMERAENAASSEREKQVLQKISDSYIKFSIQREVVIELYKEGNEKAGAAKHWEVRKQFHVIYTFCEEYKQIQENRIDLAHEAYRHRGRVLAGFSLVAVFLAVICGFLLGFLIYQEILEPLRRLARLGGEGPKRKGVGNEVQALGNRFDSLLQDVDQAHMELEQSREHLIQAEKLAMVGKLSAGVAHSIRNPLTSVKMRLFSLERSLDLNDIQREDFEVISEEIGHLNTIVGNFLEFARPPRLRTQRTSLSEVVDMTLQLAQHRLESYGVEAIVQRKLKLPSLIADPDQLKEFLMNLIMNACEAMGDGGKLFIKEESADIKGLGPCATLRICDTGPGIPPNIAPKVFEPFFSSKEEGTGLGLSIASRIITEHGGILRMEHEEGMGACFYAILPLKEEE